MPDEINEAAFEKALKNWTYVNGGHDLRAFVETYERLKPAAARPDGGGAGCYECGLSYKDGEFQDLIIPDDAWAKISPTGHGGGLLCPNCINRRLVRHGIECAGRFTSGPLVVPAAARPVVDEALMYEFSRHRGSNTMKCTLEWLRDRWLPQGMPEGREKWFVGSMNDGLFIINRPPRPSTDDVWHDRPDGPTLVLNVTDLPLAKVQAIVDAHNGASAKPEPFVAGNYLATKPGVSDVSQMILLGTAAHKAAFEADGWKIHQRIEPDWKGAPHE